VAHVPLERQSTARLLLGFVGTIVLPVAAVAGIICYCIIGFGESLEGFTNWIPWPLGPRF